MPKGFIWPVQALLAALGREFCRSTYLSVLQILQIIWSFYALLGKEMEAAWRPAVAVGPCSLNAHEVTLFWTVQKAGK